MEPVDQHGLLVPPPLFAIFGRDPALGPPPWDQHDKIFALKDHQRLKEAVELCRNSGEACMVSCTGRREDNGQPVDLEVQCSAVRDADGRITGLCGAVLDRTVKKAIERRLRRMEELLAATERLTRVGGWRLRVETGEVQWTPMINEIHEVPPGFEPKTRGGRNASIRPLSRTPARMNGTPSRTTLRNE